MERKRRCGVLGKVTDEERNMILERYVEGDSKRHIAKDMNLSPRTIAKICFGEEDEDDED